MTNDDHNSRQSSEPRDDELSELYRAASREEPPSHLDRAILDQARRQQTPRRSFSQWSVPLSMAAVVLLSVSIVSVIQREVPESLTQSPASSEADAAAPKDNIESGPTGMKAAPLMPPAPEAKREPLMEKPKKRGERQRKSAVATQQEKAAPDVSRRRPPEVRLTPIPPMAPLEMEERTLDAPVPRTDIAPGSSTLRAVPQGASTPEQWLAEIEALIKDEKMAKARQRLTEFKARFPEYRLGDRFRNLH